MNSTSSRQPVPVSMINEMSRCYLFVKDVYQPQDVHGAVALNVAPAGAFRSTASDMANFMIAHLNEGYYSEAHILQPATVQLMHSRSFSHDPHVNGMAHGFWELDMNGQRIIGHSGSHFVFNSLLLLFPEHKLGVFVSTNSRGGSTFLSDNYAAFIEDFVRHFFPEKQMNICSSPGFVDHARMFNGSFHMTYNRSENTPEKLLSMMMSLNVLNDKNGLIITLPSGKKSFTEVEPMVFREKGKANVLVFHKDSAGSITQAYYDPFPLTALIKSHWYETPGFNLLLICLCVILFICNTAGIPVFCLAYRKRMNKKKPAARLSWIAWLIAFLTSLFSLLFITGVIVSLFNIYGVYTGHLPLWNFLRIISVLIAFLTFEMIMFSILAWRKHIWNAVKRVFYTLTTIAAVLFVWFMYFWNLLGKGFPGN